MDLVAELTKIANSIRVIKGKTEKMKPSTFANEISKLAYINDNTTGKINIKQGETMYPSNTDTIIEGDQYFQVHNSRYLYLLQYYLLLSLHLPLLLYLLGNIGLLLLSCLY